MGVWDSWSAARRNVLSIIPERATRAPIVSGQTVRRWHMVTDPGALRRVLLEAPQTYPKSIVTKNVLRPALGNALLTAEGAHWRWQRRISAPAFTHRNVMNLGPVMTAAAMRAADRIAAAGGNRAVNLLDEMIAATFDVIADVTFSANADFDRARVHRGIEAYLATAARVSLLDVIGAPGWVPRPRRVFVGKAMAEMKAEADRAIAARARRGPGDMPDLLDLLLAGTDPDSGRRMTPEELRDNLLTVIVAGHETTALTLAWSLYLCAFDPGVQERARAGAQAVLGSRAATAEDLPDLPHVRQIIDEALRLYPPAGVLSRTAQAADTLCGTAIRPGDTVMLPIYALHRHHLLWDRPDAFDPGRFADRKAINRFAYMPFGAGPRICIGAQFALQEAAIILATLLARFRFTLVEGRAPRPVMVLTLRPEGGVWLMTEPM